MATRRANTENVQDAEYVTDAEAGLSLGTLPVAPTFDELPPDMDVANLLPCRARVLGHTDQI